jgi:DNA uptake protein ComE-like DNA-binding protein
VPRIAAILLSVAVAAPSAAREVERDASRPADAAPRERGGGSPRKPKKPAMAGVLNVNRATEAELKLLPGIGRGRARAIIERRNKRPFSSLDELARMKGMKGVVRRLRSHLTVDGETTLRPAGA